MKSINYDMKLFSAIAMTLVVCGHIQYGSVGLSGPFDMFKPYCYQVAAFVFVSGYFYNVKHEAIPGRYVLRKAKRLILPLYAISFVYGCIWSVAKPLLGMQYGDGVSLESVLVAPLTSGHQYMCNMAMWFIAPLFFAELANVLLRSAISRASCGGGRFLRPCYSPHTSRSGQLPSLLAGRRGSGLDGFCC